MSGSWNVLEAIVNRWSEKALPQSISGLWNDASLESRYVTLYEDEADEGAPRPYVVFEQSPTFDVMLMSCEQRDRVSAISTWEINFRIHAKDKDQAVTVAKWIIEAFDNARFDAGENWVLNMRRYADFGTRDDEDGYLWSLRYRLLDSATQVISS